jgi:nucleotide-binding universal stress UspA family protein
MEKTKILVPTDFSECALNALGYAIGLAKDIDSTIILLHVIIYNDGVYSNAEITGENNAKKYNDARYQLDKTSDFAKTLNREIEIKSILERGPAELIISKTIDSEKIDYVVMGTEGASGLNASIFGSFTSNVLLVSTCPVFTIPITGKYNGIKDVLCATEMDQSETQAALLTLRFAKKFNSHLTFLNVDSDEKEQREALFKFERFIRGATDYLYVDYVLLESSDVIDSIDNYISEKTPDLVITLGKKRSFLDRLFGKK